MEDTLERYRRGWKVIIDFYSNKCGVDVSSDSIWLNPKPNDRLLWVWCYTFSVYGRGALSRPTVRPHGLKGLCPSESVRLKKYFYCFTVHFYSLSFSLTYALIYRVSEKDCTFFKNFIYQKLGNKSKFFSTLQRFNMGALRDTADI